MVFFICEVCNESLKKNKVATHSNICRNAWVFHCMDCGQRFEGDEYASHTSCISESQKYEGKLYVHKENKGDVKQQTWLAGVQRRLEASPGQGQLRQYIERLMAYDNLPRKRAKFINFAKNSLNLKADREGIAEQLWDIVEEKAPPPGQAAPAPSAAAPSAPATDATPAEAPSSSKGGASAASGAKRKRSDGDAPPPATASASDDGAAAKPAGQAAKPVKWKKLIAKELEGCGGRRAHLISIRSRPRQHGHPAAFPAAPARAAPLPLLICPADGAAQDEAEEVAQGGGGRGEGAPEPRGKEEEGPEGGL